MRIGIGSYLDTRVICMLSVLTAASCPVAGRGQSQAEAERVLAAEADTVASTSQGEKPISHWKIWNLRDGGYEVVVTSLRGPSVVQKFRFDGQMKPLEYRLTGSPMQGTGQESKMGMTIFCQYKPAELVCTAKTSEGQDAVASVSAPAPFVFVLEFYGLDLPWFMTGVVNLANQQKTKGGTVNVYALENGPSSSVIGLKPDQPLKIAFLGEENIADNGKEKIVKTYELVGQDDLSILKVGAHGEVIAVASKSAPGRDLLVTRNYQEYARWGLNR